VASRLLVVGPFCVSGTKTTQARVSGTKTTQARVSRTEITGLKRRNT
jgi:hypothetical protein